MCSAMDSWQQCIVGLCCQLAYMSHNLLYLQADSVIDETYGPSNVMHGVLSTLSS